jgi:hypothetical protein
VLALPLVLLGALFVPAERASGMPGAAPPVASYCSPSGDVCVGVFRNGRGFRLELSTAARYFARYRLCVTSPRGRAVCRSFPIRRSGQVFSSSVRWRRNFPDVGPGVYRATWSLGDRPLARTLRFRVRR